MSCRYERDDSRRLISPMVLSETDQFVAKAIGDNDDVELMLTSNELPDATIEKANSLFSLNYLASMKRSIPPNTMLKISMSEEPTVTIGFSIADETLTAQFVLAQRVKADDTIFIRRMSI